MKSPTALLTAIAQALLIHAEDRLHGPHVSEILPAVAKHAWESWGAPRDGIARRLEVEALVRSSPSEIRNQVEQIAQSLAADRPIRVRKGLATFLGLVPEQLLRFLAPSVNPSALTAQTATALKDEHDLLAMLPPRIPYYQVGDRPLPGVDWVLTEILGMGGSGEVWKAQNPNFRCVPPVALKFCIDSGHSGDKAFRHEAALLSRAMPQGWHPGVVALRNTYLNADPPCLEYEYIGGGDLAGVILKRKSTPGLDHRLAARIIERLAHTIGSFHNLTPPIVHRDLKPANILIQRRKSGRFRLKIADFGIGGLAVHRELERSRSNHGLSRDQILCTALRGAHTPLYASPEQIRGMAPSPRDDVHALGVLWYQMLVGDLSTGAPTGLDWPEHLLAVGLNDAQVKLIAGCFASRPEARPENASVLTEKIRLAYPELAPGKRSRGRQRPEEEELRLSSPGVVARNNAARAGQAAQRDSAAARSDERPPGFSTVQDGSDSEQINRPLRRMLAASVGSSFRSSLLSQPPSTDKPISFPPPASSSAAPSAAAYARGQLTPDPDRDPGPAPSPEPSSGRFTPIPESESDTENGSSRSTRFVGNPHGSWQADPRGMRWLSAQRGDLLELGQWIARLRMSSPQRLGNLCDQLEVSIQTRFVTKNLVFSLSKWCHGDAPTQSISQAIAMRLFGRVPPPFISNQNQPLPDAETADREYDRWRSSFCRSSGA